MNLYVAVTDNDWFRFLAEREPDEVNFWRPGIGGGAFRALDAGGLFLFKLHSPLNFIVGGGLFVRYLEVPVTIAWDIFGGKNGVASLEDLSGKILRYRGGSGPRADPVIGCIVLAQAFFWDQDLWIPAPSDWSPSIQAGRGYDDTEPVGKQLFEDVQVRLPRVALATGAEIQVADGPRYGAEYLARVRLGQSAFHAVVMEAYGRQCAMTGGKALPALEAAHIKPYAKSGPHRVDNGLFLRADLHNLFDRGYLTVTEDHVIEASRTIREQFENGEEYYRMHGQRLAVLPPDEIERPSPEFLRWHNEQVYRG
jgi:putative restriction endonuclease